MRAVILQILRKPQGMIGDYSASETVHGVTLTEFRGWHGVIVVLSLRTILGPRC